MKFLLSLLIITSLFLVPHSSFHISRTMIHRVDALNLLQMKVGGSNAALNLIRKTKIKEINKINSMLNGESDTNTDIERLQEFLKT